MGFPFFFGVGDWVGCFYCGCSLEREGEDLELRERVQRVSGSEEGLVELENRNCRMGEKETVL